MSSCPYCGVHLSRANRSRDHVPPKFLIADPSLDWNQTIPVCAPCNNGSSSDEEYFAGLVAVMTSDDSNPSGDRLEKIICSNSKLEVSFIDSINMGENGLISIQPDLERIKRVVHKIALGHLKQQGIKPFGTKMIATSFLQLDYIPVEARTSLFGDTEIWKGNDKNFYRYAFSNNDDLIIVRSVIREHLATEVVLATTS